MSRLSRREEFVRENRALSLSLSLSLSFSPLLSSPSLLRKSKPAIDLLLTWETGDANGRRKKKKKKKKRVR